MSTIQLTYHKAAKYAINLKKLSDDSRTFFLQCFGCARKIYNLYVDFLYSELEKRDFVNGYIPKGIKLPETTFFKKQDQYAYLKEVDSLALSNAKIAFESAITHYNEDCDHKSYTNRALRRDKSGTEALSFKGLKGMPKFKSKAHGDFSYKTNCQYNGKNPTIHLEGNKLHLPKLNEDIELVMHRPFPSNVTIGNATVSMDPDGTLYVSIEYSYIRDVPCDLRKAATEQDTSVLDSLSVLGLDYSQQHLYVDSDGRKTNYPHYYRVAEDKLAKLQKQLARMEYDEKTHKGSKNYEKKRKQIAILSKHIANQRKDYLHKLSRELVDQYDVIAVEDIDLRAMGGALTLGKNLHDNGFGMFRNMLDYKLKEKGSCLVKVDKYFASTKICHECGCINDDVVLGVREWDCPSCGKHHDRDYNAALNIRDMGKEIFLEYLSCVIDKENEAAIKAANRKANRIAARHKKSA